VLNYIIEAAYPDDWSRRMNGPRLHSNISNIYKRKAQWCWEVVASLGAGVLFRDEWLNKLYVFNHSSLPLTNLE
jgi:hypothetical protein